MHEPARIVAVRPADGDHNVITLDGGGHHYRRQPCSGCPWRTDQTGVFPAEAFRLSAPCSYDQSDRMFGCHESDHARPATCAGFLLQSAAHNWAWRRAVINGRIDMGQVHDGGHTLHRSYRAMAEANGVPADDPALERCRNG